MIIFTPNTVIKSADVNLNFNDLSVRLDTLEDDVVIHYIGETGEPAYQNSWTNYNSPWSKNSFIKTADNIVTINMMAKSGTNNATIFTLPVGYRPDRQISCVGRTPSEALLIDVSTNGQVKSEGATNNQWITFCITFKATQ